MKQEFATPIAMKCNQEQYERIKPKLEKLGLREMGRWDNFNNYPYLCNNYAGDMGDFRNTDERQKEHYNRLVFEEWNEDLFLALAAMRKGDVICEGEYCYIKGGGNGFSPDVNLNFPIRIMLSKNHKGVKVSGHISGDYLFDPNRLSIKPTFKYAEGYLLRTNSKSIISKATAEQLIEHFTKKEFTLPEKWCVKSTPETVGIISGYWAKMCDAECYNSDWVQRDYADMYWHSHNLASGDSFGNHAGSNHVKKDKHQDHTEITFEQFKKYVSNKETMKVKQPKAEDLKRAYQEGSDETKKALRNLYPDFEFSRFPHLSLVWGRTCYMIASRDLLVWNANLNKPFNYDGEEIHVKYDYFEPYTGEIQPFMQEMIDNCK